MAGMLEFAIFGLVLLFAVTAIYSIMILILLAFYGLLTERGFSLLGRNWLEVLKASLVSASLNNLSITVISAIVISEAVRSGLGGNYASLGISGVAYPLLLAVYAVTKIAALSAISLVFWLAVAIALSAYLIGRKAAEKSGNGKRKDARKRKSRGRKLLG